MLAVFVFCLIVHSIHETNPQTATQSPKERIKILRQKIKEEIYAKRNSTDLYSTEERDAFEDYEYKTNNKSLITPIIDLNLEEKYISRAKMQMSTVKTTDYPAKISGKGNVTLSQSKKKKKSKRVRIKKPIEIFYRRIYNKDILQERQEWVHCQDVITPILTGVKLNISNPKRLSPTDSTVARFIQLLKVNTTLYGADEIHSILYQIHGLKLRLFQWDVESLNLLFNVITKERKHSFGNLKRGIRKLIQKWAVDISNITILLRQARIFRPACVQISTMDGSTKSPKITKYTKQTETTTCEDYEDCRDD